MDGCALFATLAVHDVQISSRAWAEAFRACSMTLELIWRLSLELSRIYLKRGQYGEAALVLNDVINKESEYGWDIREDQMREYEKYKKLSKEKN